MKSESMLLCTSVPVLHPVMYQLILVYTYMTYNTKINFNITYHLSLSPKRYLSFRLYK